MKLISCILLLISINCIAQEPSPIKEFADKSYYLVDSLILDEFSIPDKELLNSTLISYHKTKNDTIRIKLIANLCENLMHENWIKYEYYLFEYINEVLEKHPLPKIELSLKKSYANALSNIGTYWSDHGNSAMSLSYSEKALTLFNDLGDKLGVAAVSYNMGVVYNNQGNILKALEYAHQSLLTQEEIGDKSGIAYSLNFIGFLHKSQGEFDESLSYYNKSLAIFEEIEESDGVAQTLNNLGVVYDIQGNFEKGKACYEKSLSISIENGSLSQQASSYYNIGAIISNHGDYDKALESLNQSLILRKEIGDLSGEAGCLSFIGSILYKQGDTKAAFEYGQKSLAIGRKIGNPEHIKRASELLSNCYELMGQGLKALEMYKLHVHMKDSINNEETQKEAIRQQTQYEFEKAQIVKENQAEEQARLLEESTTRRNNLQYSLIFLGILLLFGIVLSLGFIKVSPNIAEGLIFFSFLIMFEFILVFTDPYLQELTHDEPMYNLAANAFIALLIFPLHAVLERLLKKRIVK